MRRCRIGNFYLGQLALAIHQLTCYCVAVGVRWLPDYPDLARTARFLLLDYTLSVRSGRAAKMCGGISRYIEQTYDVQFQPYICKRLTRFEPPHS